MQLPTSARLRRRLPQATALRPNVGTAERWISLAGGGAALTTAVLRGRLVGLLLSLLGGFLLLRGMSGYCPLYGRLRLRTTRPESSGLWGRNLIHVQGRMAVRRPRNEVYRYWRDLENLPCFMRHIQEVNVDGNRSHWVARTPLGLRLSWDAQITHDSPNDRLTWQSIPGADVESRGEVRFRPLVGGGTEIDVDMYYRPPGGTPSRLLATLLGGLSEKAVRRDLERFKEAVEVSAPGAFDGTADQGLGQAPITPAHG